MQFGIRDLLVLTTIAAVYAAGFAFLTQMDGGSIRWHDFTGILVLFVTMLGTTLVIARHSLRQIGVRRVAWRSMNWWAPHLAFLGFFSAYLVFCIWRGKSAGVIFPGIMAIQHILLVFNGWFVMGENGVLFGLQFTPWSQCRVQLDGDEPVLLYSHSGQYWTPRFPLERVRLPVPDEHFETVRSVLAEKKPEAIASVGTSTR